MSENKKLITLEQMGLLAARVHAEDAALGTRIDAVIEDVAGIAAAGGEANILEGFKVNDVALDIADKMVNLLVESGDENGTIKIGGAVAAVKGLQALAYKAQVSESDLDDALKAVVAAKAAQADLEALTVRVTTAEGAIGEIKAADYQTGAQVQSAIQTAISEANHLKSEIVDTVPAAETAEENVWYMVKNAETGHYDIYALVNGAVEYIDDTSVDLSQYSTTEQMQAAIAETVEALNIGDYAKAADLLAAIERITVLEEKFANYYTKEESEAMVDEKIQAAQASDEAVAAMLDERFQSAT